MSVPDAMPARSLDTDPVVVLVTVVFAIPRPMPATRVSQRFGLPALPSSEIALPSTLSEAKSRSALRALTAASANIVRLSAQALLRDLRLLERAASVRSAASFDRHGPVTATTI